MGQPAGDVPLRGLEALISRLEAAPISLALLFGSYATGEAIPGSDVDIAIEYDDSLGGVMDTHLSLVADLTRILGRDDVDVVRLSSADPRVAVDALETGRLLVGTAEEADRLRNQLEAARHTEDERVQRRIENAERKIERRLQRREHG